MRLKRFNTFKINENKTLNELEQAIEDHMNGDMAAIDTIVELSNLSREKVISILNKYTISDYSGAINDIIKKMNK